MPEPQQICNLKLRRLHRLLASRRHRNKPNIHTIGRRTPHNPTSQRRNRNHHRIVVVEAKARTFLLQYANNLKRNPLNANLLAQRVLLIKKSFGQRATQNSHQRIRALIKIVEKAALINFKATNAQKSLSRTYNAAASVAAAVVDNALRRFLSSDG